MRQQISLRLIFAILICAAPLHAAENESDARSEAGAAFFKKDVLPILKANCFSCHGGEKVKGGLRLNSREDLLKGGESGPGFDADKPIDSLLLSAVNYDSFEMPPKGKLAGSQIAKIRKWIEMGAPFPKDMLKATEHADAGPPPVNDETKSWWSFQKVKRPEVPAVSQAGFVANPIDAFIAHQLEAKGLRPNPPANKLALVRRAYYDMTGLPPTPAEVQEFIADKSPDAWERLVDRLLASKHYGEKWGRHWLDLVRYGETNSYERDGAKPHVWRYRDYVIQSLNDDKPYDAFITEQLAGDEIPKPTADSIVATGYYRLGIWQDEPVSLEESLFNDLDDLVVTTSETFLGLTVGCARCHDHKIDPIPQRDYYRMLAFFRNVRRYGVRGHDTVLAASVREIDRPEVKEVAARQIRDHENRVKQVEKNLTSIARPVMKHLSGVEKEDFQYEMNRVPILEKYVGKHLEKKKFDRYKNLTQQRDRLRKEKPKGLASALCVTEAGAKCPDTHVLGRGSVKSKGEVVTPGFPSVLSPPEPQIQPIAGGKSSGRRLALAKWLTDPNNPLTARVMVNRLWQHHFGRGIVESSSDFGFQGSPPSHPELLDWLATDFVAGGWKLKRMHKLIMTSNAYRMSARPNDESLAKDQANESLWRYNMRRLVAEEVRDSILAVNGSLNADHMFGPSIYPTLPAEILHGQSRPGAGWNTSPPDKQARRSIYVHVKRSLPVPMLASFDMPDADKSCPVRFATIQPTQALGLLNSKFINDQARVFADFLHEKAGTELSEQVKLALWRVCQREPTAAEIDRGMKLIDTLQQVDGASPEDAMAYFCLVALNLNEFMYLD